MKGNANRLRRRLKRIGLSDPAIAAAWPEWWSEDAESSASAQAELRFSLSRKLGLDPRSLLEEDEEPRFIWREEARFKHLSEEGRGELAAIVSFGTALGRYLVAATPPPPAVPAWDAAALREAILRKSPFVSLGDLLTVCWGFGMPVVHLRVFPCDRKRMAAMVVRAGERAAIMLARDSKFPSYLAFYLAHELGHVSLGHLSANPVVVDFGDHNLLSPGEDAEEIAADRFALEVLTGFPSPAVFPKTAYNAKELARVSLEAGTELRIEPGTLALCFGYSTGDWPTANAAIRRIHPQRQAVWAEINHLALHELSLDQLPEEASLYVRAVLRGAATKWTP